MPRTHSLAPVGTPAPDFVLSHDGGRTRRLSELRGQPVILAFSSGAWDPARADQLAHFNRLVAQVPGADAELLGIARDGMWCDLAFADDAVRVPIVGDLDPHGSVAERFGVTGDQAVVVVDADGVICWRHDGTAPNAAELIGALRALVPPDGATGPAQPEDTKRWPSEAMSVGAGRPNRREFITTALAAALALATVSVTARAEPLAAALATPSAPRAGASGVTLRINGRDVVLDIEPRVTLLDALREYAGLTGTKKGCDHGQCGACTVHVNGRRQLSCLTFAVMHTGDEITTLEGLAQGDTLSPMQAAFIEHDGFQCGYCTPGQIMSATALLKEPCGPSDADVRECMSGNICRCGAYPGIVAAIQDVRLQARG